MPSTLLGIVVLVVSLGPGYVYVRVAERHEPRPERSQLLEAVEMAVFGAVASTISLTATLILADLTNAIDVSALIERSKTYFADHAVAALCAGLVATLLAYLVAFAAGFARHRSKQAAVWPGRTIWLDVLWHKRPTQDHTALTTIELRDGRVLIGMLYGFTAQDAENREIALRAPLAAKPGPHGLFELLRDEFILLREEEVRYVSGKYWAADSAAEDRGDASSPAGNRPSAPA
jgi:hypothetical protein